MRRRNRAAEERFGLPLVVDDFVPARSLRALTVHRQHAYRIVLGRKRIENRTWKPTAALIGHRFAVHAGLELNTFDLQIEGILSDDCDAAEIAETVPPGIVGTVFLDGWAIRAPGGQVVSCFDDRSDLSPLRNRVRAAISDPEYVDGQYAWVLSGPCMLPAAIPTRGYQGLWAVPRAIVEASDVLFVAENS